MVNHWLRSLVGSFNTARDLVALFLLALTFAAVMVATAATVMWNARPAQFRRDDSRSSPRPVRAAA